MTIADVLVYLLLVVGVLLALLANWLATVALFPRLAEDSRWRYGALPTRATLLGAAIAGPVGVLGVAIAESPQPAAKIVGLALLFLLGAAALIGSAGLALRVGAGLGSPVDAAQPWRRALRGGVVLCGVFLAPFLGWFAVLPIVLLSGVGMSAIALWRRVFPRAQPSLALAA